MAQQKDTSKTESSQATANATASINGIEPQYHLVNDMRAATVVQRQIQALADESTQVKSVVLPQAPPPAVLAAQPPIQRYEMGDGDTRNVTVTGATDSVKFEECYYNYVKYDDGDKKVAGTGTKSPAAWAGWVTNSKGGRNATQLHVVNRRWGGLGGQKDGNIVPGSPAENSHHLHQAEKKFDEIAFNKGSKAVQNAKYECWATPKYGTAVDVSKGAVDYGDPTLLVRITTDSDFTDYPVSDGSEGLVIEDGS